MRVLTGGCDWSKFLWDPRAYLTALMPPSVWMLVYRDETSSMQEGSLWVRGINLIKFLLSLIWDGRDCAKGCSQWSIHADTLSVGPLQPDTIGLSECGFL